MTETAFRIVIPARFRSSRFPGKPLALIAGKPMILHVYERACESAASEVIVATDDDRIGELCQSVGVPICMTAEDHPTGTDRIAEVVQQMKWPDEQVIVNVQGDEPLIPISSIHQVATNLHLHQDAGIATLATPIDDQLEFLDTNNVKVVFDHRGMAHYFSRAAIPHDRDSVATGAHFGFRHLGLYAYRADFLKRYSHMVECEYESTEKLEQLRALWHGEKIHVDIATELPGMGVDTPEQLAQVEELMSKHSSK